MLGVSDGVTGAVTLLLNQLAELAIRDRAESSLWFISSMRTGTFIEALAWSVAPRPFPDEAMGSGSAE